MSKPLKEKGRKKRAPNAAPTGRGRFLERSTITLADMLYQELHTAILYMELLPGTPISEAAIAEERGVSRTPVREAVLRLAEEQLVEVVPKSGTFVARIPLSALPQAQIARRALENATVCAATKCATDSDFLELMSLIKDQKKLAAEGNPSAFHSVDEAFHEAIARIGKLPSLWRLTLQVKAQVDRFRCLELPEEGRMAAVAIEHECIVEAMQARDVDRAAAKMEMHLSGLQLRFAVGYENYPDYYIKDVELADILKTLS